MSILLEANIHKEFAIKIDLLYETQWYQSLDRKFAAYLCVPVGHIGDSNISSRKSTTYAICTRCL